MNKCPNCGLEVEEGMKFCYECGTPIPQVRKCPQCGTELPPKAKFCFSCGAAQNAKPDSRPDERTGDARPAAGKKIRKFKIVLSDTIVLVGSAAYSSMDELREEWNDPSDLDPGFMPDTLVSTMLEKALITVFDEDGKVVFKDVLDPDDKKGPVSFEDAGAVFGESEFPKGGEAYLFAQQIVPGDTFVSFETDVFDPALLQIAYYTVANPKGSFRILSGVHYDGRDIIDGLNIPWNSAVAPEQTAWVELKDSCVAFGDNGVVAGDVAGQQTVGDSGKQRSPGNRANVRTLTVDKGGDGALRTISAALRAAADGDTILVKAGTYREHFVVDKAVSIVGEADDEGNLPVIWDSPKNTDTCIHVKADATLRNLEVTTKTKVDRASLVFENGRHYEAVYVTAKARLEGLSVHGWFDEGVRVAGKCADPVIQYCRIFENQGVGINFIDGAQGSMADCEIFENMQANVQIEGESTSPYICDCEIHGGEYGGISVAAGAEGQVENCDIFENRGEGININGEGTSPTVSQCSIHNGKRNGLVIESGAAGTVEDCDIFENSWQGIKIGFLGANPNIAGCHVHNNGKTGIYIASADGTVRNCDIFENLMNGVEIDDSGNPTISACKIHDCNCNGLQIYGGGGGTVTDCDIYGNGWCGIQIANEGTNPTVSACRVHSCKGSGIAVDEESNANVTNCQSYLNGRPDSLPVGMAGGVVSARPDMQKYSRMTLEELAWELHHKSGIVEGLRLCHMSDDEIRAGLLEQLAKRA